MFALWLTKRKQGRSFHGVERTTLPQKNRNRFRNGTKKDDNHCLGQWKTNEDLLGGKAEARRQVRNVHVQDEGMKRIVPEVREGKERLGRNLEKGGK